MDQKRLKEQARPQRPPSSHPARTLSSRKNQTVLSLAVGLISIIAVVVVVILSGTKKKTKQSEEPSFAHQIQEVAQTNSIEVDHLESPKVEMERKVKSNQPFSPLGSWKMSGNPVIKGIEISKSDPRYIVTFVFDNGSRSAHFAELRKKNGYLFLRWDNPSGDFISFSRGQLSRGQLILADQTGIIASGEKD